MVGDPGAELPVPHERTVLGGHRGRLEHERVVREPERLPRSVADGEDRHDGLGQGREQGGRVVLREPLRVHEHQPGALQRRLACGHREDVPEVGARCDAGEVEGEAPDPGLRTGPPRRATAHRTPGASGSRPAARPP